MSTKQSSMLKSDILKILSKSVSGGASELAPMYPNSKQPKTFTGAGEPQMTPYYPSAQEPSPAANPNKPLPTPELLPGQKSGKRPTYKSAKEPKTFFGGEKKPKKKRAPTKYNLFLKKYAKENPGLGKELLKKAAVAYRKEHPKAGAKPMETHVMPDGSVHTGKTHTKDSVVVKPAPPAKMKAGKAPPKRDVDPKNIRKIPAPKQTRKPAGAWLMHLKQFRASNPQIKAKDVMREAKKTYTKSGGAKPTVNPVTKAPPRAEPSIPDVAQSKVPARIKPDAPAQPVLPVAPRIPKEKTEKDQNTILQDIKDSYNNFNDRFEDISNSSAGIKDKRDEYNRERDKLDEYHISIHEKYNDILPKDKLEKNDKMYKFVLETYKIGIENLSAGEPGLRVTFDEYGDDNNITRIIDERLAVPEGPMDRARSFYNKPIPEDDGYIPFVVPRRAQGMASIYPYKYQLKEKKEMGGMYGGKKQKMKSAKEMLKMDVKSLFFRDMKRITKKSLEQIEKIYKQNKTDIEARATDAIIEMMLMTGGAHYGGAVICKDNEFRSGDKCYRKKSRAEVSIKPKPVMSAEMMKAPVLMPDASPLPLATTETKPTADAANPLPDPKPQNKDERNFVEKFSAAVTPPDRGPIFGTDGSDISDPKAWIDTLGNIAVGTAQGVKTIFDEFIDLF